MEPGIVPVAWSSDGSRVSIRILSGEGLERWACTWRILDGILDG
jgi:hypothetical protein